MPKRIFSQLVAKSSSKPINDLETDEITLFHFLVLIVDIKYRVRYGCSLQDMVSNKQSTYKVFNGVLPDQIPFVDSGLEGARQRRIPDEYR